MNKFITFIKSETVLVVSLVLALISAFFVHPGKNYIEYIDFRTLGLLFSLMIVTEGYKKSGVFEKIARKLIDKTKNAFQLSFVLVFLCFFSSMIITNDVALITFVPLAITALKNNKENKMLVPVIVLQTIAANLGSMFTPIGNPQNLYLFGISKMKITAFLKTMFPFTAVAAIMLIIWLIAAFRKTDICKGENPHNCKQPLNKKTIIYNSVLFILCLFTVSKVIDWKITCFTVLIATLLTDRKILKKVDYSLLLTFCGFFIFTGNMGKIDFFEKLLQNTINGNEIFISIAVCQIISNVPCALLLSGFTHNVTNLLIGTNIGGLGTLIASMASLISYKQIAKAFPEMKKKYFGYFTFTSVVFLTVMIIVVLLYSLF